MNFFKNVNYTLDELASSNYDNIDIIADDLADKISKECLNMSFFPNIPKLEKLNNVWINKVSGDYDPYKFYSIGGAS